MFIMPIEKFIGEECIQAYQIAHNRAEEGYKNTWYEKMNDEDGTFSFYKFKIDSKKASSVYLNVETYSYSIVP
jgi:hypothetical protein